MSVAVDELEGVPVVRYFVQQDAHGAQRGRAVAPFLPHERVGRPRGPPKAYHEEQQPITADIEANRATRSSGAGQWELAVV